MKLFYSSIKILVFSVIIAGTSVFIYFVQKVPDQPFNSSSLQCAHWSIFRSCQLLGVPVSMDYLIEKLPSQKQGHSMMQMAEVLQEIGFQTEGRRENIESLKSGLFPCIAHLSHRNHFVVISEIDDDYVHVFDGNGRRTAREKTQFAKDWSGNVLFVKKPADSIRLPVFLPKPREHSPVVSFNCLICDLGTVPATGETVAFQYTLRNIGDSDLIIEDIRPDCSCIKNKKTEEPINPGEQGIIELYYHVQPQKGPFSHEVIVKTNDPIVPVVALTASGWSGVEIKIEPHNIHMPDIAKDNEKQVNCFVKYTGEGQDLQLEIDNAVLENAKLVRHDLKPMTNEIAQKQFHEMLVKTGAFDNVYLLELTFSPEGTISDIIEGHIDLKTNIAGYEKIKLNVFGRIVAPIRAFPEILTLDNDNKIEITLVSQIKEPFKINRIILGDRDVLWDCTNDSMYEKTINLELIKSNNDTFDHQLLTIQVEFLTSNMIYELPIKVIP